VLGNADQADAKLALGERLAPRDDVLVTEAVRLQGAFVALARAMRSGTFSPGGQAWASVEQQIDRVRTANADGRSLFDQSDDIRSTLRILEAELARAARR
jgi:hypothetical protein